MTVPYDIPYSSPEARSRAFRTVTEGRMAVRRRGDLAGATQAVPDRTPLDEFLFELGRLLETDEATLTAIQDAIPAQLVARPDPTIGQSTAALRVLNFKRIAEQAGEELATLREALGFLADRLDMDMSALVLACLIEKSRHEDAVG